jgi:folate-binding protein YgfZ
MQPKPTLLPDWSVLPVSGPDAAAFLQAQLMNDVRALADGHWQWTGWLTPKGRVRFLGVLLRAAPEQFFLVVPDWRGDELADALRRFVFRSKVAFDATGAWRVAGEAGDAHAAAARDRAEQTPNGWSLDLGAESHARTLHLLAPPADTGDIGPERAEFTEEWRAVDLAFGLPRLAPAQREAYTPQMLSLERLRAFSLAKGCYPGQEIVSRTHFLGQAKRGLELVEGEGLAAGGDVRDAAGAVVGTLASVAAQGRLALAVLPRERAAGPLHAGVGALRARALAEGLQRPV